jgi:predicted acyltransferase
MVCVVVCVTLPGSALRNWTLLLCMMLLCSPLTYLARPAVTSTPIQIRLGERAPGNSYEAVFTSIRTSRCGETYTGFVFALIYGIKEIAAWIVEMLSGSWIVDRGSWIVDRGIHIGLCFLQDVLTLFEQ